MTICSFVFFEIFFDISPAVSFREFFADEVGAAHFVEHLESVLWCLFENVAVRIHLFYDLHDVELDFGEASFFVVGDVDLYAAAEFAFRCRIVRFVVDRAEANAREIERVEVGSERVGIEPRSTNGLERERVAYAHVDEIEFAKDACNRVVDSRLRIRNVR